MKKMFSTKWISSTQRRKQRKYRYNAPKHILSCFSGAKLHKTLREKYGVKTLPVIKGDKVKIVRGSFAGKEVLVEEVYRKENKLILEKVRTTRRDGSETPVKVDPSNVIIVSLNLEDKRRIKTSKASNSSAGKEKTTPVKNK